MSHVREPLDPLDDGVALSRRRLSRWALWQQHLYAAAVTAVWIFLMGGVVVILGVVLRGDVPSPVMTVVLVWVSIFAVVVMTWLFWNMALPLYADLLSGGRFSPWRARRFARADSWFSRVALVVLVSVVFLPLLQLLE